MYLMTPDARNVSGISEHCTFKTASHPPHAESLGPGQAEWTLPLDSIRASSRRQETWSPALLHSRTPTHSLPLTTKQRQLMRGAASMRCIGVTFQVVSPITCCLYSEYLESFQAGGVALALEHAV